MERLTTLRAFRDFRKRIAEPPPESGPTLVICAGTGGQASGSNDILRVIKRTIVEKGLSARISIRVTGCQGFCEMDPFIVVEPGARLYPKLHMEDVPRIIDAAVRGEVVEELLYRSRGEESIRYDSQGEIPFFKHQKRLILGRNAKIDPIRIFDYIKKGGYSGLEKVLERNEPAWIVEEVLASGLRGRGGGGFPTGRKWKLAKASSAPGTQKYFICNADEGDPGAYMDRSLLEGNPHGIIEGMAIGGIAIGATRGIVYVRTEYPLAIKHTLIALRQARELGLLGENILGSGRSFDIEIVRGAGAFVCGEETALIASIEGRPGEPRQRPPYPIEKGLWGRPTCINNVETIANVPLIFAMGSGEYAKIGVPGNSGTKIFSLVGKVMNTGLVEVPMGTTIHQIVHEIGGGSNTGLRVKAVQTGGPSGGCIPADRFDMPIDYDTLTAAGSIMGSGGMIVMDENTCMVDVAKYFMAFLKDESCGKCFTCRKGTQRMHEILDDITKGKASLDDLALLEELALVVKDTTMCGLGQTASNPILSTLRYFREEYLEHILHKRCPAGVCKELVGAPCQNACPVGTEAWRYVAHIARKEYDEAYRVIREANPFPSACARVCHHPCESFCRAGKSGGEPVAIRALKRFVTDTADPGAFQAKVPKAYKDAPKVAVIGAGPSGLTAAHLLSLTGCRVTIHEAESKPGGMLICGIPAYRLPREVLAREIASLMNENIDVILGSALGRDISVDGLLNDGFDAVYVAIGSHQSRRLQIEGEDAKGVLPGIRFLKAFNLEGEELAAGRVGVIGGGNSAVDAARVALRQNKVERVTIFYRRTIAEMPAYREEIEAALEEGIEIVPLVSPLAVVVRNGKVAGVRFARNALGDYDQSGRKRPVPVEGSEFEEEIDTLIAAIGEQPGTSCLSGLGLSKSGTLAADRRTLATDRPGVFAGGDVVTGSKTVIEAIAAGKKAARAIRRYLDGEPLEEPATAVLPGVFIPAHEGAKDEEPAARVRPPALSVKERAFCFDEVDRCIGEQEAIHEARRCLRCDLEFTQPDAEHGGAAAAGTKGNRA
ncbi:MAG: FAD-dependent oxidoreductase [Deltaproteobacteria bacterium]|nr:FAD-dependent oxidoreductase [Deltaproteobacteria bacterium]